MRLWSLHPRYLDARGLVALWREGLLAQAVLRGETRGYQRHPQLQRFREQASPSACIAEYLGAVHAESVARGYRFNAERIGGAKPDGSGARPRLIPVTRGQLRFEWRHLAAKLETRDPGWFDRVGAELESGLGRVPQPHPLFSVVDGGMESWERGDGTPNASPRC